MLPRVKNSKVTDQKYILPFNITVSAEEKYKDKLALLFECFFPKSTVVFSDNAPNITVDYKPQENSEGYRLSISDNGIFIECDSYLGLRNALATVSVSAEFCTYGYSIDCAEIEDYPVVAHRGTMLDLGRGIKPFDILIDDVIIIAKAKMNYLHLHLSDRAGVCVKLDCLPSECLLEPCYSKNEMRRLQILASALGLEIIPEFDMPAHSTALVKGYPQIDCKIEGKNTHWVSCAGNDKTYEVYEKIISEICELFSGEYFHIGGDELEFGDVLSLEALCHWDECPVCQSKIKEENLKNRQELYYYFVNRIHKIVRGFGRRMIMWSDQIDCKNPPKFDKDILMQFWRIAAPKRGPFEDCSFDAQLALGYEFINSYFPETYFDCDEYMSEDTIKDWQPHKRPYCDEKYKDKILGSEACAWEYGNYAKYSHYDRTLAPAVALMADKLWCGDDIPYGEEYEKALTKLVLGISAKYGINLFKCMGTLLPPRNNNLFDAKRIKCSKAEIKAETESLRTIQAVDDGSKNRIRIYLDLLERILNYKN